MPDTGREPFDVFYKGEHLRLIRFLRKLGASWEDAWDISQHAHIEAFVRWDHIEKPIAWIRITARRAYRSLQVRENQNIVRVLCGDWQPRPHFDRLHLRHEEEKVCDALARLPPRQAEVMAWTYDGFPPAEIAEILSELYPDEGAVTPDAVRASLYQARKKLKREFAGAEGRHE